MAVGLRKTHGHFVLCAQPQAGPVAPPPQLPLTQPGTLPLMSMGGAKPGAGIPL